MGKVRSLDQLTAGETTTCNGNQLESSPERKLRRQTNSALPISSVGDTEKHLNHPVSFLPSSSVGDTEMHLNHHEHIHGHESTEVDTFSTESLQLEPEDRESFMLELHRRQCASRAEVICRPYTNLSQSGNQSSEDIGEEIDFPTRFGWFMICLEKWGMSDDAIREKMKVSTGGHRRAYQIHTDGICRKDGPSGYGAVLCDPSRMPIAACSRAIAEADCISTFHHQLLGVLQGFKMAKKYQVPTFSLYCPSGEIERFVSYNFSFRFYCYCSGHKVLRNGEPPLCRKCSASRMRSRKEEEHDKAYKCMLEIIDVILELKKLGFVRHVFNTNPERYEAAYWMARLGEDRDMNLKQISETPQLAECFYKNVFWPLLSLPDL